MKKVLLCVVVALMAACTTNEIDEVRLEIDNGPRVYAVIDNEGGQRVELNDQLKTVWTAGDQFVAFDDDENVYECTFTGSTGDRDGEFTVKGLGYFEAEYNFRGKHIGFYPYAAWEGILTYKSDNTYPLMVAPIGATQNYKAGSYDPTTNYMIGSSDDGQNYTFRNLHGYLRLSLTGDKKVKKIAVKGNKGEALSGMMFYDTFEINTYGWYQPDGDTITLDCGEEGVQLTDSPTEFYITMAPTVFEEGITVDITFTDGTMFPKATSKSVVVSRNTIQPMATFETSESAIVWQSVTISHTGSQITAPILYGSASLVGTINWGDGSSSEIEPYSYIYRFADEETSHQVVVKAMGATRFVIHSCEGVSKIDFSKF